MLDRTDRTESIAQAGSGTATQLDQTNAESYAARAHAHASSYDAST